jgi:hypothetical protein
LKNPLALPTSAHKVKESRNRASGLPVMPALMRLNNNNNNNERKTTMQAIQTKYIPATSTSGSKIEAKCGRRKIRIPYPHELSGDEVHREAVRALLAKFVREDEKTGTPPGENGWGRAFITGTLADGITLVHVLNF